MARLKLWMIVVGTFYVLLGMFNTPYVIGERLAAQYPNLGVPVDSSAAQALIDTWFMFGLEVLVIGVALLYFSRDARRHAALVWTVITLELVRGVGDDLYLIARGSDALVYGVWIVIHLTIIVSGLFALRHAPSIEAKGADQLPPGKGSVGAARAR